MAKQPKKLEATEAATPARREKAFECQLAGRLGLGVAVVKTALSLATPENLAKLKEAFDTGSELLGELFNGLRPKKKPTPEVKQTE